MPIKKGLRNIVFERDSFTCIFCEQPASECHHVVRSSQGGRNHPQNLVSVCRMHHLMAHGERVHWLGNVSWYNDATPGEWAQECFEVACDYLVGYYGAGLRMVGGL